MAQRSVPAPFLTKTYQMVEDPSTDDVISWNEDGTTFVVWKTADFAKDLLPKSFKHNNFSSFVRQLNTYGFRKTAPDKWEFANDYFKRGNKELLSEIRRRKTVSPTTAKLGGAAAGHTPSNSGEDMASTSTSLPDSKNPGSVETAPSQLVEENKRLRKDNESLSSELASAKKQCDELVAFLTHCKVGPDQIDRILMRPIEGRSTCNYDDDEENEGSTVNKEAEAGGGCLKLFGVVLRKRARDGEDGLRGPHSKEIKICI